MNHPKSKRKNQNQQILLSPRRKKKNLQSQSLLLSLNQKRLRLIKPPWKKKCANSTSKKTWKSTN